MIGCGKYTREKWERFIYLLRVHAEMYRLIMQKCRWADSVYSYFDFYAGPGLYTEHDSNPDLAGEYGSPVLATRILDEVFNSRPGLAANGEPLEVRSFIFDPYEYDRLSSCLRGIGLRGGMIDRLPCDRAVDRLIDNWREATGCSPRKPVGLAFFDPNGVPDWDSLRRFSGCKLFRRVDLLININTAIGRLVRLSQVHPETMTSTERLRELGKEEIYLWEPAPSDKHQFALAFCTNCPDGKFPEFRRQGFHRIDSERGGRIARRIDLARWERTREGLPGYLPGMGDLR
jgi:hypothetical protein